MSQVTNKESFYVRRTALNSLSLFFSAVMTGVFIGYNKQKLADSGEIYLDKIFISTAVSVFSYFLAVLLSIFIGKYKKLNYFVIAILGSAFCALFLNVIKYLIDNWKFRGSATAFEYINGQLRSSIISFFLSFLVYSILSLIIFSIVYFSTKRLSRPTQ